MNALAAAAQAVGGGFLYSLWGLTASPWGLVIAAAWLMLAATLWLRRWERFRSWIQLLPPEPDELGEIGDDAIAMVREKRLIQADSVTQALREMEREWNRQQGDGNG